MFWQKFICLKEKENVYTDETVIMTKDDVDTIRNSQKHTENNNKKNNKLLIAGNHYITIHMIVAMTKIQSMIFALVSSKLLLLYTEMAIAELHISCETMIISNCHILDE